MAWDCLLEDVACEFAPADEISEVTETELWRQYRGRAERAHALTRRGGGGLEGGIVCQHCRQPFVVTSKRGTVPRFCSTRCRVAAHRAAKVTSLPPTVYGPTDCHAGYRDSPNAKPPLGHLGGKHLPETDQR